MTSRMYFPSVAVLTFFGVLSLPIVVLAHTPQMEPGDTVIVLRDTHLKAGKEKLAPVAAGTELVARQVRGGWVAVTVEHEGKKVTGWIWASHGRIALTGTSPIQPASPSEPLPRFSSLKVHLRRVDWFRVFAKEGQWSGFSLSETKFDPVESKIVCGSQRSRITHSGHVLAAVDPLTFRMIALDPLTYSEGVGTIIRPKETQDLVPGVSKFPKASTIVWVEPGKDPNEIIVTTDPARITDENLKAVGLTRATVPELKLEFSIVPDDKIIWMLGEGAQYWGATSGPVKLGNKRYRNLRGARVENGVLTTTGN